MTSKTLIIVGAGGFGREVLHWAEDQMFAGKAEFTKLAFIDDNIEGVPPSVAKYMRSSIQNYVPQEGDLAVIAVGKPKARRALAETLTKRGTTFGSVIHPSAMITRSAHHETGLVLCPYSTLSVGAVAGKHLHINFNSTIGHDCTLGDFITVSSHVDVMGNCEIEDGVFFGSGARVLPGCKVAQESSIGAGTTVQRSIKKTSVLYQTSTKRM